MPSKRGPSDSAWLQGYQARRQRAASRSAGDDPQESTRAIAEARVKTGDFIARLMMAYVGFAAFCFFTLLSPDRLMIEAKPSLNMPFAGTVSFLAFMMVAPAVLIGMRVYLWVYLRRWRELDAEMGPGSEPKTISPLKHPLLRFPSWAVLYPMLPLLLTMFTWKAAAKDVWGEAFLVLTLLCTVAPVYRFIRWHWSARAALIVTAAGLLSAPWLWADGFPHRGLNLAREDLRRAYLFGENLKKANLVTADLSGADLRHAALQDARLNFADLSGAGFTRANLADANLRGANLDGAFLQDTNLAGANLERTTLTSAELWGDDLTGANFWGADLTGADLLGTNLQGTNFEGTNLTGVSFEAATNIPNLSEACADPDNLPKNLPDNVSRPDPWEPCP